MIERAGILFGSGRTRDFALGGGIARTDLRRVGRVKVPRVTNRACHRADVLHQPGHNRRDRPLGDDIRAQVVRCGERAVGRTAKGHFLSERDVNFRPAIVAHAVDTVFLDDVACGVIFDPFDVAASLNERTESTLIISSAANLIGVKVFMAQTVGFGHGQIAAIRLDECAGRQRGRLDRGRPVRLLAEFLDHRFGIFERGRHLAFAIDRFEVRNGLLQFFGLGEALFNVFGGHQVVTQFIDSGSLRQTLLRQFSRRNFRFERHSFPFHGSRVSGRELYPQGSPAAPVRQGRFAEPPSAVSAVRRQTI